MIKGEIFENVTISAKVIRKDGRVEDLGVIAKTQPSLIDKIKGVIMKWQQLLS